MERKAGMELLYKQLAADYACSPEEVSSRRNVFSVYRPCEGRRMFDTAAEEGLKIVSIKNKLLFSGKKEIIEECRRLYQNSEGAWFFEMPKLMELNRILNRYGVRIDKIHPFFVSFEETPVSNDRYEIRWFEKEEILQFKGDSRFSEAFTFKEEAPDELGAAVVLNGQIAAMAGASGDSPSFWQIGINVLPEARGNGFGVLLVTLLKNEILRRGRIPYYGTAFSHTLSQGIAVASGFLPAWTELITAPENHDM